jgi:Rod binding domain-containing protein
MINGINQMYHLKQSNPDKALDMVCKGFESTFAYQLMKTMGESISEGLFDDSLSSDIYKDMLYQAVGDKISETGALGIGKVIRQHLQSLGKENEKSNIAVDVTDKNIKASPVNVTKKKEAQDGE